MSKRGRNRSRQSRPKAAPNHQLESSAASGRQPGSKAQASREHKEQARARRIAEQHAASRRRKMKRVGKWTAAGVAAALIVAFVVIENAPKAPASAALRKLISAAPAEATSAGCTSVADVSSYTPSDENHAHIGQQVDSAPALDTYPSVPAASGPHDASTISAGVYSNPPDIYKMIHSLEHGAVELWYAPSVTPSQLSSVETFVKRYDDHTVLAPYDYPGNGTASTLKSGYTFALVSWQKLQMCKSVPSTGVIANFLAKYRWPTLGGGSFQGSSDPDLEKGSGI
jgi:hypothetical protein